MHFLPLFNAFVLPGLNTVQCIMKSKKHLEIEANTFLMRFHHKNLPPLVCRPAFAKVMELSKFYLCISFHHKTLVSLARRPDFATMPWIDGLLRKFRNYHNNQSTGSGPEIFVMKRRPLFWLLLLQENGPTDRSKSAMVCCYCALLFLCAVCLCAAPAMYDAGISGLGHRPRLSIVLIITGVYGMP